MSDIDSVKIEDTCESDPDLIVPIDMIDQIPEKIRPFYVSVDSDPMNLYHSSLFIENITIEKMNCQK